MRYLSILILSFLFSSTCFAQLEIRTLSPKKMKKDLEELLNTVNAHPDPYTKISKEAFQSIVDEVEKNISIELDQIDFYKNMARIVAAIRDGHSRVFMPNSWLSNIRKKNGVFPYEMYLTNDGKLFVMKSYGDEQLPLGCQILEINGMKVEEFVKEVSSFTSYETVPFCNDKISRSFEFMLYLVFKKVDEVKFKFLYAKESEAVIKTMPYKEWKTQKKDLREERDKKIARGEPYDFSIIKPGIAKIDIFSFSVSNIEKFNFFLNKTFKEIENEKVHSLIIDVRGNYGGWPKVASELFHYIHQGYFKTMAQSSMKISHPYRRYFTDANPILRNASIALPARRHFVDIDQVLNGKIDSYVKEDAFFNEAPIKERFEFLGDCYLLIDRKSYSASSSFASTFQCYSMGYIIGEPTGGTKIFRANAIFKTLPATSFVVRMSTTKLYTTCFDEEDQPITPNVEVIPSILDKVHKVDSPLNMALMMIKKVQKAKATKKP